MDSRFGDTAATIAVLAAAEELLLDLGANLIGHPGGTLFDHVRRVQGLLSDWGANTTVQLAGLCHACYGTDGFILALFGTDERSSLTHAIGETAEALVYLYGSCDRDFVYPHLHLPQVTFLDRFTGTVRVPDEDSVRAFVEILAANELDVIRHSEEIAREHGEKLKSLIKRVERRLSVGARQAWGITS